MKNTLGDLNLHLFDQLERLSDTDLSGEALDEEIKRAKAVTQVSGVIIDNATLVLQAQKYKSEWCRGENLPDMLDYKHA